MGSRAPQPDTPEYFAQMCASAVTVGQYMQTIGTFIYTTGKKIFHIASDGEKMLVREVLESNFTVAEAAIPTPKLSLLDIIKNSARKELDKRHDMCMKVKDLLAAEIKSGNVSAMRVAGAAMVGFTIGFIFGAAESTLRKFTPQVTGILGGLIEKMGVGKGKAMDIAESLWGFSLTLALGAGAATLGFITGLRLAGPIGGLVGAGAGLVGYMVGREVCK
jgi:hypothetical protein